MASCSKNKCDPSQGGSHNTDPQLRKPTCWLALLSSRATTCHTEKAIGQDHRQWTWDSKKCTSQRIHMGSRPIKAPQVPTVRYAWAIIQKKIMIRRAIRWCHIDVQNCARKEWDKPACSHARKHVGLCNWQWSKQCLPRYTQRTRHVFLQSPQQATPTHQGLKSIAKEAEPPKSTIAKGK